MKAYSRQESGQRGDGKLKEEVVYSRKNKLQTKNLDFPFIRLFIFLLNSVQNQILLIERD